MNQAIKPTPIITLPAHVPSTRVVHMSRLLQPECKGQAPEHLQAALVLRSRGETLVILREDLDGNEP